VQYLDTNEKAQHVLSPSAQGANARSH